MTNDELFLESIIHTDHRVYGYKMKPLTLFHLALLDRFKSPITHGGKATKEDIQIAALICSSSDINEFNRKSKSLWVAFLDLHKFPKQQKKFEDYYFDYMQLPSTDDVKNGKASPFPYILSFLAKTIKETGYSVEHIFYKMPVGLLIWLNSAFGYLESGETNVMSDTDKLAVDALTKNK